MPSKTMRRRISDTALAPIRKALRSTFRDMEDQLDQLGNSGLPPGGEPDGDEVDDGADDNHIHIHMHGGQEGGAPAPAGAEGTDVPEDPVEARFQAIEGALSQIMEMLQGGGAQGGAPAGEQVPSVDETPPPDGEGGGDDGGDLDGDGSMEKTEDRATVGDSAALATSWQSLVSDAEILYPGFRVPTHDAKLTRAATIDRMCNIRRQVLDSIYVLPSGKALVDGVTGQTALDTSGMSCGNVAVLFKSAAAVKRSLNNRAGTTDAGHLPASPKPAGATKSIAELNAANKAFWDARKAKV